MPNQPPKPEGRSRAAFAEGFASALAEVEREVSRTGDVLAALEKAKKTLEGLRKA